MARFSRNSRNLRSQTLPTQGQTYQQRPAHWQRMEQQDQDEVLKRF
jgi:hypothetical protein